MSKRKRSGPILRMEPLENRYALALFVVSNVEDSGEGSLRDAIISANKLPGADRIEFNVRSISKTIQLRTALPRLTDQVEIDATVQPGFVDHPVLELDGAALAQPTDGLVVAADNSLIRGLTINNFYHGIVLINVDGTQLAGNYFGIGSDGTTKIGNQLGVYVLDSSNNLIGGSSPRDRNVISGNGENGIRIAGTSSRNNRVQGNYIGTDAAGLNAVGNNLSGILLSDGASQSTIGTNGDGNGDAAEGNIISGNGGSGIWLSQSSNNRIAGNRIGVGTGSHTPLGNRTNGIELSHESSINVIGTNSDGTSDGLEGNVIACNKEIGVRIHNSRANTIAGNFIGILADGTTPSPNLHSGILIDGGSHANRIGRSNPTDASARNIISSNGHYGIWLTSSRVTEVWGNLIGLDANAKELRANRLAAIRIDNSNDNSVGAGDGRANAIGYDKAGISVVNQAMRNQFSRNNFIGASGQAIDLGLSGLTSNDALDADEGPNGLQNYPDIQSVLGQVKIAGQMVGRPFSDYDIQLYIASPSADGTQVRHDFFSNTTVRTNATGIGNWLAFRNRTLAANESITAIAYEFESGTSEFSPAINAVAERSLLLQPNLVREADGSITATVSRVSSDPAGDLVINLTSSDRTRVTLPSQVTIPAGANSVNFQLTLLDDSIFHYDDVIIRAFNDQASGAEQLIVIDNENAWHNYGVSLDVSGDGRVTAIDALLIINELNSARSGSLLNRFIELPPRYFDTSNDNNLTSIDALLVINTLNSGRGSEGEAEVVASKYPEFVDLEFTFEVHSKPKRSAHSLSLTFRSI